MSSTFSMLSKRSSKRLMRSHYAILILQLLQKGLNYYYLLPIAVASRPHLIYKANFYYKPYEFPLC
jgi:hypothetical protein